MMYPLFNEPPKKKPLLPWMIVRRALNQGSLNREGKIQLIEEVMEVMENKDLDWLFNLVINKYAGGELVK